MIEAEPWSYHVDGSPVYSLADIIAEAVRHHPGATGGENVYPAEVESVLTGHPAVAEVAVVGVPSARWGESPYAVVVLRPGAQVSEAELIAWTRDRLAHFKCPAGVSFAASLGPDGLRQAAETGHPRQLELRLRHLVRGKPRLPDS